MQRVGLEKNRGEHHLNMMQGRLQQTRVGEFGEVVMVGRGRSASESATLTRGGGGGEVAALSEGCVEGEVIGKSDSGTISTNGEDTVKAVEGEDGSSGGWEGLNGQDGCEGEDLNEKSCSSIRGGELASLEGGIVRGGGEKRRRCATASGGEFQGEGEAGTGGRKNGKLHRGENLK